MLQLISRLINTANNFGSNNRCFKIKYKFEFLNFISLFVLSSIVFCGNIVPQKYGTLISVLSLLF